MSLSSFFQSRVILDCDIKERNLRNIIIEGSTSNLVSRYSRTQGDLTNKQDLMTSQITGEWTARSTEFFMLPKNRKSLSSTPLFLCDFLGCIMTSSNGNIFRVTGPSCGEFTGHRWIPLTKASDAELWFFSLIFSLMCAWIKGWANNREADDLRRHRSHYYVTVMWNLLTKGWSSPAYFHYKAQPCGKHFHVYRVSTCWYADMLVYA